MTEKKVLVTTKKNDPTADHLFLKMNERRVPYLRLNLDVFPIEFSLSLKSEDRLSQAILRSSNADEYSDSDIRSIFLRRKPNIKVDKLKELEAKLFGEREYCLMVYWWLRKLNC